MRERGFDWDRVGLGEHRVAATVDRVGRPFFCPRPSVGIESRWFSGVHIVRKLFSLPEALIEQVSELRHDLGLPSENEAIRQLIAVGLMVVKNERELDRAPGVVNDPHMPHTAMAYGNRADGRYRPLRDKMKLTLGTDPD
jgi:hypothetical protein